MILELLRNKMKILEVISSLRAGGAETLVTRLVPLLNNTGHKVDVLVFDGESTPLKIELEKNGINVFSLNTHKMYSLKNVKLLSTYIKSYDIVHTHTTPCQLSAALAKSIFKCDSILVTTEHSTDNRRRHMKWYKPIDKWMYSKYEKIIAISEDASNLLGDYLGSQDKIITINNGIDVEKYENCSPKKDLRKENEIIITMVASFRPAKDQKTLILALKSLPENYKLWLVGDGELRNQHEILVKNEGMADRVKFWGNRTDIPEILKTSDIIVLSSHWEGFGLAAVEGMAAQKPVVASNVPGLCNVVANAGELFEEGNSSQLSEIIKRLGEDPNYRRFVAQKCLARSRNYDISKTAEGYLSIYDSLFEKNHK